MAEGLKTWKGSRRHITVSPCSVAFPKERLENVSHKKACGKYFRLLGPRSFYHIFFFFF